MTAHACDHEPSSSRSEQLPASLFCRRMGRPPVCPSGGRKPRPPRSSSNFQTLLLLRGGLSFEAGLVDGLAELLLVHLAIVIDDRGESFLHTDIGSLHSLSLLQAFFHAYSACAAGHSRNLDLSGGVVRHCRRGEQQKNRKQP